MAGYSLCSSPSSRNKAKTFTSRCYYCGHPRRGRFPPPRRAETAGEEHPPPASAARRASLRAAGAQPGSPAARGRPGRPPASAPTRSAAPNAPPAAPGGAPARLSAAKGPLTQHAGLRAGSGERSRPADPRRRPPSGPRPLPAPGAVERGRGAKPRTHSATPSSSAPAPPAPSCSLSPAAAPLPSAPGPGPAAPSSQAAGGAGRWRRRRGALPARGAGPGGLPPAMPSPQELCQPLGSRASRRGPFPYHDGLRNSRPGNQGSSPEEKASRCLSEGEAGTAGAAYPSPEAGSLCAVGSTRGTAWPGAGGCSAKAAAVPGPLGM